MNKEEFIDYYLNLKHCPICGGEITDYYFVNMVARECNIPTFHIKILQNILIINTKRFTLAYTYSSNKVVITNAKHTINKQINNLIFFGDTEDKIIEKVNLILDLD